VVIDSDVSTELTSGGTMAISSTNANMTTAGVLTMMKDVMAKMISLTQHQHQYINVNSPSQTTAPLV
jgi:hypothetical protein